MIRMRVIDQSGNIIGSIEIDYMGSNAHCFTIVENGLETKEVFAFTFGFLDQNLNLLEGTSSLPPSSIQECFLNIGEYSKPELLPGWQKIPIKPTFSINHELR